MNDKPLTPIETFVQELSSTTQGRPETMRFAEQEKECREKRPWDNAHPKLKVGFQARLPDHLHKKMEWVCEHTMGGQSMQNLLLTALDRHLGERIAEIENQLRSS
jgi:hypothetical protein